MLSTREMGQDAKAEITREMLEGMLSDFDRLSDSDGVLTRRTAGQRPIRTEPCYGDIRGGWPGAHVCCDELHSVGRCQRRQDLRLRLLSSRSLFNQEKSVPLSGLMT